MSCVSISQFHNSIGWEQRGKVWHAISDCNICSSLFMKQKNRDHIKFWRRVNHQSSLKNLKVNIQKIIIMLWMEKFQDMVHFIIIHLFDRSGVWIWNWCRFTFNWKPWMVNYNITIINGMMIKCPHDSWNYRTVLGRRGPGFKVIFWRLYVTLSWWLVWLFTMKGIELIHLSSKNW